MLVAVPFEDCERNKFNEKLRVARFLCYILSRWLLLNEVVYHSWNHVAEAGLNKEGFCWLMSGGKK